MLHCSKKVTVINSSIEDTVRELLASIPEAAHSIEVSISVSNLLLNTQGVSINVDGRVFPLNIHSLEAFDPVYIWITWGEGNLESYTSTPE